MASRGTVGETPSETRVFDVRYLHPLRCFSDLVRKLGGDPDAVAIRADVAPSALSDQGTITFRQIIALLETAAEMLDEPDFGLRLAMLQGTEGMFGPVGDEMRDTATLGQAIRLLEARAAKMSRASSIWTTHHPEHPWTMLGIAILVDGPLILPQVIEQTFLLARQFILELTGERARPVRVQFRHQPLSPMQTYHRYFGCEVLFGQPADTIVYTDSDLACPVVAQYHQADAHVLAYASQFQNTDEVPVRARVRIVVTHLLSTALCNREEVARRIMMHPRTMDRRLGEEGAAFLQIKNDVRRQLLHYYATKTGLKFVAISQSLGFSEQSVMIKSSRKWFSKTPKQLRADERGRR